MNKREKEIIKLKTQKLIQENLSSLPYTAKFYKVSIYDEEESKNDKKFVDRFYKHISKIINFNEKL